MKTPQLEHLLSSYYHEDFDIHGGLWGALDQFMADSTRADVISLGSELERVLASLSETEVESLLDSYYCAVYMGDEPGGYRGWLEEMARRVVAYL